MAATKFKPRFVVVGCFIALFIVFQLLTYSDIETSSFLELKRLRFHADLITLPSSETSPTLKPLLFNESMALRNHSAANHALTLQLIGLKQGIYSSIQEYAKTLATCPDAQNNPAIINDDCQSAFALNSKL